MKQQPPSLPLRLDRSRTPSSLALRASAREGPRTPIVLHLFSGPIERVGGFASCLKSLGLECEEWDIVNGEHFDLTDGEVWLKLKRRIDDGEFDGALLGPPCNSFSNARNFVDGGPPPLRAASGPARYGRSGLLPKDKEAVRIGTLLAVRAAEVMNTFVDQCKPVCVEQPIWKRDGRSVSMFNLDEFATLLKRVGVSFHDMAHCHYGAKTEKATTLFSFKLDFADLVGKCTHSSRKWIRPSDGHMCWSPHPPLHGKEWHLSEEQLAEHVAAHGKGHPAAEPGGGFISKAAAAYPEAMNRYLAKKFADAICQVKTSGTVKSGYLKCGKWGNVLIKKGLLDQNRSSPLPADSSFVFSVPLRGLGDGESGRFLGGMRHPRRAIDINPTLEAAGKVVFDVVSGYLRKNPDVLDACIQAVGSDGGVSGPAEIDVAKVRELLEARLPWPEGFERGRTTSTRLHADLLLRWGVAAGDVDAKTIYEWLVEGAPAGIAQKVYDPGVFPPSDLQDPELDYFEPPDESLHTNYVSVDNDPDAEPEVRRLLESNFVKVFDSLEEAQSWAGGRLHLSKLAMITTEKDGRIKRRLIMDCRRSSVNDMAARGGKLVLPRISDVVDDLLYLLDQMSDAEDISMEMMVLDFSDWFYQTPLARAESKHFAFSYKGKFAVYTTQPQGSRNAPVVCGRVAALVGRLTQGALHARHLRLQIFVDDPFICAIGPGPERKLHFASLILMWEALGIKLAYRKGAIGKSVGWIGANVEIKEPGTNKAAVIVKAKPEMMAEIREATSRHETVNLISKKELASYTGKLNHIAGMIEVLRPFLSELYGALHGDDSVSKAPAGMVWTKQWAHTRAWLQRLLNGEGQVLQREYRVDRYFRRGQQIRIVTDASPWGIGGYLAVDTIIHKYFSMPLTPEDVSLLGVVIGSPDTQQVVEALALLVALRLWETSWKNDDACLTIQSDSVSALSMIYKLRTSANRSGSQLLAKELALLFGSSAYKPVLMEHIPGLSNKVADVLSRMHMPGEGHELPSAVMYAQLEPQVLRDRGYYMSLRPLRK